MKHKVLIDTLSLLSPITGIGRYTYEISKRIDNKEFELYFYYGYISKKLIENSENRKYKILKKLIKKNAFIKGVFRKLLITYSKLNKKKFNLYWQPNFIPLSNINSHKIISSVHDFSFILYEDHHPEERIKYFKKYFYKNIKKSDFIITGSQFTRQEIISRLNFDENKVKVIYHGIDHNIFKVYSNLNFNINTPDKFILSVGSMEPRKNLLSLLKAYNSICKTLKKEYKLLLVGFKGWNNKEIKNIINRNKDNIEYLGYLSDIDLAKIYNKASIFIYPSLYEGFGLPPIEAMACGTPVITSNTSSLPEIAGNAAVYCNPLDIQDIKNKIEMVLQDKNLQKNMKREGLKRARQFTWEKSVKEHIDVFKEVLNS